VGGRNEGNFDPPGLNDPREVLRCKDTVNACIGKTASDGLASKGATSDWEGGGLRKDHANNEVKDGLGTRRGKGSYLGEGGEWILRQIASGGLYEGCGNSLLRRTEKGLGALWGKSLTEPLGEDR